MNSWILFHLFLQTNNDFFSPREKDNWKSTRNIVKQKSGNFVSVFTEYNNEIHRHKVESYGLRNKTCISYRKAFLLEMYFFVRDTTIIHTILLCSSQVQSPQLWFVHLGVFSGSVSLPRTARVSTWWETADRWSR